MPEDSYLICPHCRTRVPHGANVCTGCQAEVEYGAPPAAVLAVLIIAGVVGFWVGSHTMTWLGWTTFVVALLVGIGGCFSMFEHRVYFKRIYRTR